MAVDPFGVMQIVNGIDRPLRFDPAVGSTERAGIQPPLQAIVMSGSGAGGIVGEFKAYLRFIDRDGFPSSVSPQSATFQPSVTTATVSGASNASPIVITTSAAHGLGTGQTIQIDGIYGNDNANGIWTARVLSATTFELWNDSSFTTASLGNGTYNSGGTVRTGCSSIIYSNLQTSTESRVVRRQILRNRDGDFATFYIDIDTTDLTSSTLTSLATNDSLIDGIPIENESGLSQLDKSTPPENKSFIAHHLGRMFTYGVENYSEGAVAVTNGSTTVTGLSTEWGQLTFAGRFFRVIGDTKTYTIASIASTTSITLSEAYTGSTDPYALYIIHTGDDERASFYFSEAQEPEAFPIANRLALAEDPGAGEATGLLPLRSWIHFLKENRTLRFSFVNEPLFDGFSVQASKRGCVNDRCHVTVEETAYMMDYVGFHAFMGNDDQDISTPGVKELFRNNTNGQYRINWGPRRYFHSVYDPGESIIRWYVTLSGHYTPYHAVAYQHRMKRWWIEEYPFPISASVLGRMNGRPQVFLATSGNRVLALNQSTLDGLDPNSGTVSGTVTSSGVNWIVDSTATFPTSNTAGNCVCITGGKGKGQRRQITSISSTKINVAEPWMDRPDTTSTYQIGGIQWKWRTGWLRWAEDDYLAMRSFSVQFRPTSTSAEMHMRLYRDLANTPQSWVQVHTLAEGNGIALVANDPDTYLSIDSTKYNGWVQQRFDGFRDWYGDAPRFVSVELGGTSNKDQLSILRASVDGAQ